MGKSTISNAMFNSYVRLPEGRSHQNHPKPTVPDPSVKFNQFNLDQLAVRLLIDRPSSSSEGLSHPRPYLQGNSTQFFQQTWLESRVWQWSVYPPKKHHWWITIGGSPLVDHHWWITMFPMKWKIFTGFPIFCFNKSHRVPKKCSEKSHDRCFPMAISSWLCPSIPSPRLTQLLKLKPFSSRKTIVAASWSII